MSKRRTSLGIETLERRRMLSAAVDLAINFAPKRVPGASGMISDVGLVYGDRGDGLSFGWQKDNSKNARDRDLIADQSLDTLAMLQVNGGRKKWEIALPDGNYDVTIAAGDARYVDSVNTIAVEGTNVVKTTPSVAHPFNIKTKTVAVTDGKLTVRPGADAENAKINWIRIVTSAEQGGGETPVTPANVSVSAADATAAEGTSNVGVLRLARDGDSTASLTVNLAWGGTAGASDLTSDRPGTATFAAGQTTIDLPVVATDDDVVEGDETATLTVAAGTGYAVGASATATVVITDTTPAPVPTPTTLKNVTWAATTSAPEPYAEAQSAVVNGKFYRMGGYYGNYTPVRRVDRFDAATKTWTRMADLPIGITHAGTAVVGDKIWLVGGYAERVGSPGQQDIGITSTYVYDTTNNTWSSGPALPARRGRGELAYFGGKLYYFSGERGGDRIDVADVWAYDPARPQDGWVTRAAIPEARSNFGSIVIGDEIYCFGGQLNHDDATTMVGTAYAYKPSTDTWRRLADLPTPMSHLNEASVEYHGKIYAFGGSYPVHVASSQVIEYDPATNAWRRLSDLPVARDALAVGVVGDQFLITGGRDRAQWVNDAYLGTIVT